MKIYLVRHAEEGAEGHLSSLGREQARKLSRFLASKKIGAVFSSDRPRSKETAEIVAGELGLETQVLGDFEEVRELKLDEADKEVAKRVRAGINFVTDTNESQDVAIIAHSKLIRLLLGNLRLKPYREDDPDLPNAGIVTLDFRDGKYQLLDYGIITD